ncbi:long-chain fatty acid--CoA ligase [Amphritea opalescens]|uniref:Long-chain fatty acid--CoA ligase n=1 Tax=Amphritea opalescens TaxID=2490544 RepID=A0A430KLR8_9GAMM|nr:AMP-binding protein [Amphritea opalescens]RTE64406.1 long-chain fatty acid--CoA ligase [Amphritea opalescens]
MDIVTAFEQGLAGFPERACFVAEEQSWSYREIDCLTNQIANKLLTLGLGEGTQGAVLSANDAVAFSCVLGIMKAGMSWVPLNAKNTADNNRDLCNAFDAQVLFYHSNMVETIQEIRNALPKIKVFICVDRDINSDLSIDRWLGDTSDVMPKVDRSLDKMCMILPTGGTTGMPKGAMLSRNNLSIFNRTMIELCPHDAPPVYLAAAPLTHAAGLLAFPIMAKGGTTVITTSPDALNLMELIEKHGVTDLFLPPTLIYMMLSHPKVRSFNYSSLKYFIYGAAPMSVTKLKEAITVFGPVMTQFFGQSEAPCTCAHLSASQHLSDDGFASDSVLSSCGKSTPYVELAILDEMGCPVKDGERGEMAVRSDLVMLGYYKNPTATAEATVNGWHLMGDIAFKDADGYYHLVDRKKDMIITGGFNVFSSEVEQALLSHEAVQDCAVIGVPDDKWGEAVKAVVQLQSGKLTTEIELIEHAKSILGSVKSPKTVEIWEDLPRSPVGKVLKRAIREKYWVDKNRLIN